MNEEVIRIEDIVYALKKRWKLIAISAVVCTLVAGIVSFFVIKPKYEAKVKVFIGKEEVKKGDEAYNNNDVMMYQKLMKTYAEIIKTNDSTKKALTEINQNTESANVSRVLAGIKVTPSADTQIMDITYTTTDRSEIVPVINSVTNVFIDEATRLIPNGNVQIIQKAEAPNSPISPNKKLNVLIGLMLGLMIGVGIAFLLEYLDNTVKSRDELENILDLPVIGMIPDFTEQ